MSVELEAIHASSNGSRPITTTRPAWPPLLPTALPSVLVPTTLAGVSVKLFARLQAQGVDIIAYRKGKRQALARSYFSEHQVLEDGQEKSYWLYDQPRVRVGRLRPHRQIGRASWR